MAALVAPRPLLLSNTDRDGIFPLDGVIRTYEKVRKIYELYGARDSLGLHLTAGPHSDTQELQIGAFRWLNKHLQNDTELIDKTAVKLLEPEQLKVFDQLPTDQRNTEIHDSFVPAAEPPQVPSDAAAWQSMRDGWRTALLEKSFRAWPVTPGSLDVTKALSADRDGLHLEALDFTSQEPIRLRLYLVHRAGLDKPESVVLHVLDDLAWKELLAAMRGAFEAEFRGESLPPADEASFRQTAETLRSSAQVLAYVAPRGVGPTAWDQSEKKQTQHRRRFYLLGQTLDGMQVWDVRRAIQTLRTLETVRNAPLSLQSWRTAAGITLYAALFEPDIRRLDLWGLPPTHRDGPYLLNVQRYLELPQTVAMAAEKTNVVIIQQPDAALWEYPAAVIKRLGWDAQRLQLRPAN